MEVNLFYGMAFEMGNQKTILLCNSMTCTVIGSDQRQFDYLIIFNTRYNNADSRIMANYKN